MTEQAQPATLRTASTSHRPEGALAAALQAWAKREPQQVASLLARWVDGPNGRPGQSS